MKVKDVKKVAVFGAGTMGPGLALVFAMCGLRGRPLLAQGGDPRQGHRHGEGRPVPPWWPTAA